jgi:hypothetical protein
MPTGHAYAETRQKSLSYQKRCNMSKKLTRVDMNFSMIKPEPVGQVKATGVVMITARPMMLTTIYLATVDDTHHVQL